jgi:hypothetical protein
VSNCVVLYCACCFLMQIETRKPPLTRCSAVAHSITFCTFLHSHAASLRLIITNLDVLRRSDPFFLELSQHLSSPWRFTSACRILLHNQAASSSSLDHHHLKPFHRQSRTPSSSIIATYRSQKKHTLTPKFLCIFSNRWRLLRVLTTTPLRKHWSYPQLLTSVKPLLLEGWHRLEISLLAILPAELQQPRPMESFFQTSYSA